MPNHRVLIHSNGPALWPEHKPLMEVLELKATTPELVWSGTYQGVPTPPGGHIFKRTWWRKPGRRFDHRQPPEVWGRYISWDTGLKDKEESDFSAYVVMDILADYTLTLRYVEMERLEFPDLPERILRVAERWNADDKLNAVIIEDKNSGTSALQTLRATAPDWLAQLLAEFLPSTDKVTRAGQAAVWCKNGSVLLPYADRELGWLIDFEDELFNFPGTAHDDRVDAFSQVILYLERYLEYGFQARSK